MPIGKTVPALSRLQFLLEKPSCSDYATGRALRVSHQTHGMIPGKEEEMGALIPALGILFADGNPSAAAAVAGVFIPIVAIVAVFTFVSIAVWVAHRSKEREAFYKAETLRKIAESSGEGGKAAIELLREEDRLKRIRAREGLKLAGLINIAVGVALIIFLWALVPKHEVSLCGLIPGFIGVAMLVYVFFLATPIE